MLRYKDTETVLSRAKFPGDVDHTYLIAISSKEERKANIAKKDRNKCRIAAAVEIQRVWRGYFTRSKLWQVTRLQDDSESEVSSQQSLNPLRYPGVYAKYQKYLKWCKKEEIPNTSPAMLSMREYAAQIIQSWWKITNLHRQLAKPSRVLGRKDGHGSMGSKRGSIGGGRVNMGGGRGSIGGSTHESLSMREAATIIQRVWRRHNDIKVFQFYRELINFQGRGNPNLMLRSINPKEAQLLDKAAGAHVRFRLGGIRFPPNIYYKIFTRRPIVDLCASSPRDYTSMEYKMQQARDRNNVNPRIPPDQSSWYQRHENNGWRLVSDRHFLSPCQDTITIDTSSERKTFHHSQLQRKKDMLKKQKRRKIEWLTKMYKDGMLVAREELGGHSLAEVEQAAEDMVENMEEGKEQLVPDKDIDDLLGWTNALNFDEYITEWHTSASSGFSDENYSVHPSPDDRYELTVINSRS